MGTGYITVTETPGIKASKEQLARLYQRYCFALPFCRDKEVLEVACGAGQGLGYLAKVTKRLVGGDIDENILKFPREHYQGRNNIEILQLDAQKLPFADGSFDVVIIYEAIYYLSHPELFFKECRRVLKENGICLICTVNKDWPDFNRSPYSVKYFSVPELYHLLAENFSDVQFFGAFNTSAESMKDKIISITKRTAVALHLIPKTMKGKETLKRLFFGRLSPLPSEVTEGMARYSPPVSIPGDTPDSLNIVIYVVAHVGGA